MSVIKHWTINAIYQAHQNNIDGEGKRGHFFDDETIRFFKSIIYPTIFEGPGGVYFVTSERGPHSERKFTVRAFNPDTHHINTYRDSFQGYLTRAQANTAARKAAEKMEKVNDDTRASA